MNLLLLIAAFGAVVTGGVLAVPDCTTEVTKCATGYTATTSTIDPTNQKALCDALIVEYDCLKLCDAFCTGSDRSALDTALNSNVLPTLIKACPGQVCEADLASCTNNYTTGQAAHQNDKHLTCRNAAQFEVCLSNIQSTCKPEQQAQITATLKQIRPTVSQACKGEDCQVQANNCNDLWSQFLTGGSNNNKQLACVSDMGLIICLQDIEVECTPDQKKAIDDMVTPASKRLSDNCKGQGCSPKLIECTANWNTSIMASTDLGTQCTADQNYEYCLRASEVFCTTDEKNNIDALLKPIAPQVTKHCGGDQACETDLASCTNNYTAGQAAHQNDKHLTCRDAAQFELCLSNIQSVHVCTTAQQAQITSTLKQIRPQITKACKDEDCQVQANNCNTLWGPIMSGAEGSNNKQLACVSDMGLIICLQDIEVECTPDQRKTIDGMVTPASQRLSDSCKGQGCSPKLIECTANWNTSIMASTDLDTQCTADKGYEKCLHDSEVFCTTDEKNSVETLLKPIAPKITQHCGVGDLKPWSFLTLLVAGALLVKRFA